MNAIGHAIPMSLHRNLRTIRKVKTMPPAIFDRLSRHLFQTEFHQLQYLTFEQFFKSNLFFLFDCSMLRQRSFFRNAVPTRAINNKKRILKRHLIL